MHQFLCKISWRLKNLTQSGSSSQVNVKAVPATLGAVRERVARDGLFIRVYFLRKLWGGKLRCTASLSL